MTRQVTDNLYIELDYFTPEEYYTYEARAVCSTGSSATVSATMGVIKATSVEMSVTSTVAATISHIEGADLFAFTEAALSANVGKIVQLGSVGARTPKTISVFGNAQVSTVQKKFGLGSVAFDGTGDYISVSSNTDFQFGTGNFTFEGWFRRSVGSVQVTLFDFRTAATQNAPWLFITSGGTLAYYVNGSTRISGAGGITIGNWHHVAVSRSGTSTRIFVNGNQIGSTWTDSTDYIQSPLTIGARYTGAIEFFNGYIDELRVTKNLARYTANFTAPTAAFVNDADTVLLVHGDTDITDDPGFIPQNVSSEFNFDATVTIIEPQGEIVEASGSWSSTASLVVETGKILNAASAMTVTSTVAATISHIEGADLFAFTEASLAVEVSRIRDNNIAASAVFDIAVDYIRIKSASAEQFAEAVFVVDYLRVRYNEAAANAAFSISADAGKIQQAQADLTSELTLLVTAFKTTQITASLSAKVSLGTVEIPGVGADVIRDVNASLNSQFTLLVTAGIISNTFAVFDTVSNLSAIATINRTANAGLSTEASQTALVDRIRIVESLVQSQTELTVLTSSIKTTEITQQAEVTLVIVVERTRNASADFTSAFTPILTVDIFKNSFAVLDAVSNLTISAAPAKTGSAALITETSQTALVDKIKDTSAVLNSEFTLTAAALDLDLAEVNISSAFAVTANIDKYKTAFTYVLAPAATAYNTTFRRQPSTSGSSVVMVNNSQTTRLLTTVPFNQAANDNIQVGSQDFTVEMWIGTPASGGMEPAANTSRYIFATESLLVGGTPTNSAYSIQAVDTAGNTDWIARFYGTNGQVVSITSTNVPGFGASGIGHVVLSRSGDNFYFFVQGSTYTATSTTIGALKTYSTWWFGQVGVNKTMLVDETRLSVGVARYDPATYTQPTDRFNFDANTRFLFHFDDTSTSYEGVVNQTAALTSTASLSANTGIIILGSADLVSEGFVTAVTGFLNDEIILFASSGQLSAQASTIKSAQVQLTVNAELTNTINKVRAAAISLSSASALVGTVVKSVKVSLTATSTTAVSAQLTGTVRITASLLTQGFAVTAASRIRSGIVLQVSNISLSASARVTRRTAIAINSNSTLTVSALDLDLAQANLTATTALSAQLRAVILGGRANLTAFATQLSLDNENPNIFPFFYDPTQRNYTRFDGNFVTYNTGFTVGTGDFTMSLWFKNTIIGGTDIPTFDLVDAGGLRVRVTDIFGAVPGWQGSATNTAYVQINVSGTWRTIFTFNWGDYAVTPWYNIKLVRKDGLLWAHYTVPSGVTTWSYRLFTSPNVNGLTYTNDVGSTWIVNDDSDGNANGSFDGSMDEFYVIKDYALYPSSVSIFSYPERDGQNYPINIASADLRSQFTLAINFLTVKFAEVDLTSQSQLSGNANRLRSTPVATTSTANLTVSTTSTSSAQAQLVSTSTVQVNANRLRSTPAAVTSSASLTVNNLRPRNFDSAVNSTTELTADSARIRFDQTALETITALAAQAIAIKSAVIATESIASTLDAVTKIGDFLVGLDVIATMTVDGIIEVNPVIDLASEFLQTANTTTVVVAESSQSVETALFVELLRVRPGEITANSLSELSAQAIKVVGATATLTTTTAITANVNRARDIIIPLLVNTTVTALGSRTRNLNCAMSSVVYDFTCSPTFIVRIEANFTAFNTQLTAGRVIHLDPLLTWRIEPETRYLKINDETRVYSIEEETRIIKIKGYVL